MRAPQGGVQGKNPNKHFPRDLRNGQYTEHVKSLSVECHLIACYSDPGDTILDTCCFTGICGEAALRMGRRFVGVEILDQPMGKLRIKPFSRACYRMKVVAAGLTSDDAPIGDAPRFPRPRGGAPKDSKTGRRMEWDGASGEWRCV